MDALSVETSLSNGSNVFPLYAVEAGIFRSYLEREGFGSWNYLKAHSRFLRELRRLHGPR